MRSLSSYSTVPNVSKLTDTITGNLPSREELLNAIGLASRSSTTSDVASAIAIFGAGMLIGAGLALLFAPKSGAEMRRDLGERFSSEGSSSGSSSSQFGRSTGGASAYGTTPAASGM